MRAVFALCCLCAFAAARAEELASTTLRIAAASDLRSVLHPISEDFRAEHAALRIEFSFGASGKLSSQIEHGAPYDLFLSADHSYAERLRAAGLTVGEPGRYARGRLLLWLRSSATPVRSLAELPSVLQGKLALANPLHAPYGLRAQQALQAVGVWDALQDRLVYGENVAQAAQLVISGAAEGGLIAHALAAELPAGGQRLEIDPSLHEPLWQTGVVLKASAQQDTARALLDHLLGAEGQVRFRAAGFLPPDAAP